MIERRDYTPVALYARVSSDRQDVDLSVAGELRALRDHARKNNYMVVREFVDEAESGRLAARPQFRKMIDEASMTKAPFKEILVWKFSRFTRMREHAVAFKSMLRRKGVRVVSITEHADNIPTGKLLETIIESVDEFYSENLAQEVTRGMREASSCGFWISSHAPFGYKRVMVQDGPKKRSTLEIDPDAAPIVKRIFDMAEAGARTLEIIRTLNNEGISSPRGNLRGKTSVHRILTNEAYTGTLLWGANAKDEADPVRVEKAFPAIVSRAKESASRTVNAAMTAAHWLIGHCIVDFDQSGEQRAEYGATFTDRLAEDLTGRFKGGFSRQTSSTCACSVSRIRPVTFARRRRANPRTLPAKLASTPFCRPSRCPGPPACARCRPGTRAPASSMRPRREDLVLPEEESKAPIVVEFLDLMDEYSESDLEESLNPPSGDLPHGGGRRLLPIVNEAGTSEGVAWGNCPTR